MSAWFRNKIMPTAKRRNLDTMLSFYALNVQNWRYGSKFWRSNIVNAKFIHWIQSGLAITSKPISITHIKIQSSFLSRPWRMFRHKNFVSTVRLVYYTKSWPPIFQCSDNINLFVKIVGLLVLKNIAKKTLSRSMRPHTKRWATDPNEIRNSCILSWTSLALRQ